MTAGITVAMRRSIAVPVLALIACVSETAGARILAFEVTTEEAYGEFAAGPYVRIEGRVTGELQIGEPIPDLEKADADGDGKVGYATDLILVAPAEPASGNGTLIVDVENRGRPITHALYNSPNGAPLQLGSPDPGTGLLQDRGFLLAIPSWELGHGVELPSFTDRDGRTRYIEGVGFALIRDIGAWLKGLDAEAQSPLGEAVVRMVAVGYSQSGRLLKSFLLHGFNDLGGERVFDGMHLQAPHAGLLPLMQSGPGPDSVAGPFPSLAAPDLRGVHEPPFTYPEILARAQARGSKPPKLIVTNMGNDYYSLRASLARTGPEGIEDVALPDGVRLHDVAGGGHAYLPGMPGCELARGTLDWSPVMRAVLLHLDGWLRDGVPPPDSALMPLTADAKGLAILGAPPSAPETVVQVPKVDADGNARGGVRLPAIAVPLGTHRGQNGPSDDVLCTLSAAFVPFARTRAEREAAGDGRLSIEERYPSRETYVRRVEAASAAAVEAGFLLPEDASATVEAARRNELFH